MNRAVPAKDQKPLIWIGSSKRDLKTFPSQVRMKMGKALGSAQLGDKHQSAKPWKGDGPGVLEVVSDYRGDTFRAVYTVRFERAVYVLHSFQKKSKAGIKTPQLDQEMIARRLKAAELDYKEKYGNQ